MFKLSCKPIIDMKFEHFPQDCYSPKKIKVQFIQKEERGKTHNLVK